MIYNRKLTKLQWSFKLYKKAYGINSLWYITSFYVNQEGKKLADTMHSSLFCLFSSFNPDIQGIQSLKYSKRNMQSQLIGFTMFCCAAFNTQYYMITSSLNFIVFEDDFHILSSFEMSFIVFNSPNTPIFF